MASKSTRNKKKNATNNSPAPVQPVAEEAAPVATEAAPEPVAGSAESAESAVLVAAHTKTPAKKSSKKGKAETGVALLDPPSVESAEVAVAEEAVAQGLAVVRPDTSGESSLRGLGLQAELDSLRAQQADWEQARKAWEQERAQLISQREELDQSRLAWESERSELNDKVAESELELELTQRQLAELQTNCSNLQARLGSAEQEAADELRQITSLQDEIAETSRRLERREAEMEQWAGRVSELQASLDELRENESNLRLEMEELELLKEDLEETIVERRRELKVLRVSEAEARSFAEECKGIRDEAEGKIASAQAEAQALRLNHQGELKALQEQLESYRQRQEELQTLAEQAKNSVNLDAVKEAERRHLEAEKRLIEVNSELESLRKDGGDRERLERRCLLLETDLKAANQELMTLERNQSRLETENQQLSEELEKAKGAGASGGGTADEAEIRQWKLRADDLRESLRKQRTENERLQERVDVLLKAKELEEKQRKEVESRLRTALRIQSRQQGGF